MIRLTTGGTHDLEELILNGVGHEQRRSILKIIDGSSDGVIYSDILNELQLNTGKLNYHLKLLDGLIERGENRRYVLTSLGEKSMRLLRGISEDLDDAEVQLASAAQAKKNEFVHDVVSFWSKLVMVGSISFVLGLVTLVRFNLGPGTEAYYIWFVPAVGVLVLEYYWLEKVKREAPDRIVEFLHRLKLVQ